MTAMARVRASHGMDASWWAGLAAAWVACALAILGRLHLPGLPAQAGSTPALMSLIVIAWCLLPVHSRMPAWEALRSRPGRERPTLILQLSALCLVCAIGAGLAALSWLALGDAAAQCLGLLGAGLVLNRWARPSARWLPVAAWAAPGFILPQLPPTISPIRLGSHSPVLNVGFGLLWAIGVATFCTSGSTLKSH